MLNAYKTFKGHTSPGEFLGVGILCWLVGKGSSMAMWGILQAPASGAGVFFFFTFLGLFFWTTWIFLATVNRRLRDAGHSTALTGAFAVVWFLPLIDFLVGIPFFIYLCVRASADGGAAAKKRTDAIKARITPPARPLLKKREDRGADLAREMRSRAPARISWAEDRPKPAKAAAPRLAGPSAGQRAFLTALSQLIGVFAYLFWVFAISLPSRLGVIAEIVAAVLISTLVYFTSGRQLRAVWFLVGTLFLTASILAMTGYSFILAAIYAVIAALTSFIVGARKKPA